MKAIAILAILAAGTFALSTCATTPRERATAGAQSPRECFFLAEVDGFRDAGRDRIYVDTSPRETFLFETFGTCPDLDFAHAIAFDQRGPGQICGGIDVDLIVPSAGLGPQRCPVRMIRKLSGAEREAAR